jgi:hypothetical protein
LEYTDFHNQELAEHSTPLHSTWTGSGVFSPHFLFPTHSLSVTAEEMELRAVDSWNWWRKRVDVSSSSSSANGKAPSSIASASGVDAVQSTALVNGEIVGKVPWAQTWHESDHFSFVYEYPDFDNNYFEDDKDDEPNE